MSLILFYHDFSSRQDGDGNAEFKAMILSLIIHVLLLLFEILLCNNINEQEYSWILAFAPIYIISPLSIMFCIWELRHDRSVEVIKVWHHLKSLPLAIL